MDAELLMQNVEQPHEPDNLRILKPRLQFVGKKVTEAKKRRAQHLDNDVLIVAVGKTKPVHLIAEAYKLGQRHFGENYVNELQLKSNHVLIDKVCPDIKWHFIGHVQSNKVKKLVVGCPNLYMVHTIDSDKIADVFNRAWEIMVATEPLNIMIQVNTSREASKSGVMIEAAEMLFDHVISKCPQLNIKGLMTIGTPNHDLTTGPNPEYLALVKLRDTLAVKFKMPLQLSMGMSHDYEHAIHLGSNYVRIGERIFGVRKKPT